MATISIPIKNQRKNRIKIFVCSLKHNTISIIFCFFCAGLVLFSKSNLVSAKNGLILWATAVVPSLFPFFVSTELLSYTNVVKYLGKILNPIMRPLFNVPGEGAFAFLMGLISGYPVGAKIVANFMEQGIVTKDEAERLLAFTNNSGPLFIIGTVGITLFGSTTIGILLFITHILSCITVGITLRFTTSYKLKLSAKKMFASNNVPITVSPKLHSSKSIRPTNQTVTFATLGEILGKSISNSVSTILMIGGFVVIFSVIISILNQSGILDVLAKILFPILNCIGFKTELTKPILSGIVELTNGVNLVANTPLKEISTNIIASSFLLGIGGFSVLLQVFSIISKFGLSIKTYTIGKILQGIFSAIYTYIAICIFPFLQFNLII